MYAHASANEHTEIERLRRVAEARGSRRAKLDLAQVLLEPAHREDEAFAIYESLLAENPNDADAAIGASYVHIHTFMAKANLRMAVDLLSRVLDQEAAAGRAEMLLAEVLGDLGELDSERNIALLQRSVARAPSWSRNHLLLAVAYRDAGMMPEARLHIGLAIQNRLAVGRPLTLVETSFEDCYTGRRASDSYTKDVAAEIL